MDRRSIRSTWKVPRVPSMFSWWTKTRAPPLQWSYPFLRPRTCCRASQHPLLLPQSQPPNPQETVAQIQLSVRKLLPTKLPHPLQVTHLFLTTAEYSGVLYIFYRETERILLIRLICYKLLCTVKCWCQNRTLVFFKSRLCDLSIKV